MPKSRIKSINHHKKIGSIRIIAGKHRGRKLPVIAMEGLRPTTDRVKETVFNWLMPYINSANCLDCFAGSGSLGMEALSRGAEQVLFLELNKQVCEQLKANIALLQQNNVTVKQTDSLKYLQQQAPQTFDIVFLDPPFHQNLLLATSQALNAGWLASKALIYIECETSFQHAVLPANWQLLKEKKAGQVAYRLYQNT